MSRTFSLSVLVLTGVAVATSAAAADVIVRGPFGRQIVIPTGTDVRLAPGAPVLPAQPPPPKMAAGDIVSVPMPLVRPEMDGEMLLPPPKVLGAAPTAAPLVPAPPIPPREFAKLFKPLPGNYEVTFEHPISKKPVTVAFALPSGLPRVTYGLHALVFDYGQHEVEIRFKIGNKVVVRTR